MHTDNPNRRISAETQCDEAELDAWFDSAGLSRPENFQDESLAPPVREEILRSLLRGELPEADCRAILLLVHCYRSWYEAYIKLMLHEYHQGSQSGT